MSEEKAFQEAFDASLFAGHASLTAQGIVLTTMVQVLLRGAEPAVQQQAQLMLSWLAEQLNAPGLAEQPAIDGARGLIAQLQNPAGDPVEPAKLVLVVDNKP